MDFLQAVQAIAALEERVAKLEGLATKVPVETVAFAIRHSRAAEMALREEFGLESTAWAGYYPSTEDWERRKSYYDALQAADPEAPA